MLTRLFIFLKLAPQQFKTIKMRAICFSVTLHLLAIALTFSSAPAQNHPNIVVIFADDMGYGDVSGINPLARTQTPAIDQLIGEGITFTEAHASASV
jgi:hypothetical protein